MIREWWDRQMDARRVAGLALAAVSLVVCVLAMAAAFAFVAPGNQDAGGFARYSAAFGGTLGVICRAYLLHRHAGPRTGLLWALVQGGSMALLLFGMVVVATAISPAVGRNAALGGDMVISSPQ